MDLELKKYLYQLSNKNIDKNNIIMNLGLLIEKNLSKNNPTDYILLLPSSIVNISIDSKDIDEIVDILLHLLKTEPVYTSRIVWCIGKTFDENKIETLLLTIIQSNFCDDETFKQIQFLIDVIKNETIILLFGKISRLNQRY